MPQLVGPSGSSRFFEMVMVLLESPALWSPHIIRLLWGWMRGELNREGEGGRRGRGGGGSLPVKAARQ